MTRIPELIENKKTFARVFSQKRRASKAKAITMVRKRRMIYDTTQKQTKQASTASSLTDASPLRKISDTSATTSFEQAN